jgi:hypothetical protein
VAAGDAAKTAQEASQCAVLLYGADHVVAARGVKPALAADQRAERVLVEMHQADEHQRRQSRHNVKKAAEHLVGRETMVDVLPC